MSDEQHTRQLTGSAKARPLWRPLDALRAASYDGLEEVHLVGFTAGEVRTLLEAAAAAAQEAAQDAPQAAALDAAPAAELDATVAA